MLSLTLKTVEKYEGAQGSLNAAVTRCLYVNLGLSDSGHPDDFLRNFIFDKIF